MSIDPTHSLSPSSRLLVSVQSIAEAVSIRHLPVGIIDFKCPAKGALGRCDSLTLEKAFDLQTTARGISAACGELRSAVTAWHTLPPGFQFAKAGPSELRTTESHREALKKFADLLPEGTQPVAVAYADNEFTNSLPAEQVLQSAVEMGYRWFLIDTMTKDGRTLLDWISAARLSCLMKTCRNHGIRSVIAGSISIDQLPSLASHRPDLIGVRGAVCSAGRTSGIDPRRVARWCDRVLDQLGPLDMESIDAAALQEQAP